MKRLIAMISKGRDVSEFFAQVVKNVAVPNLEVRKLVYIYLLRYAEVEPDLALLSINTFQRDLADSSPLIRAMALRVLSGIRVPSIGSLVVLAIKKCATDVSPYVRKTAALSLPKCYNLDDSHLPALIQILSTLLRDRSPLSIGSVAVAFEAICPTRLDLLHPHYRRLCRVLVDVDEWGQVNLLELLIRYARTMLPRPSVLTTKDGEEVEMDRDLELLVQSSEPLFQSRNPSVVLSATRAVYYLALPSEHPKIVVPLLRVLDISKEVERTAIVYILSIARTSPHLFSPYYTRFIIHADDSSPVKATKMRLLQLFVTADNHQALLREFIDYADDDDDTLVEGAIRAIGHIARVAPESSQQCLNALMAFIKSRHDIVVSSAVLVLKSLVQTQLVVMPNISSGSSPLSIISRLAYRIDEIHHPNARACVIWLVGQYGADETRTGGAVVEGVAAWAPDVLRRTAKTFREEMPLVKLQVITLAAKLLVLSPADKTLTALARYVFSLARYDANYDVRDRARVLHALLAGVAPGLGAGTEEGETERAGVVLRRAQVKVVLFEGKAGVIEKDEWIDDDREMLGTMTLVTGREMRGERFLPDWLEEGIESALRDSEDDLQRVAAPPVPRAIANYANVKGAQQSQSQSPVVLTPTGSGSPAGSAPKKAYGDLNDFYASSESEESGEDEEEDDGDGEDGEDGDSEEDSEEEEDGEAVTESGSGSDESEGGEEEDRPR
ncbi:adaptin N terminal region-domain-containing protein [Amylostereum chailletii]|nr:adaptin N terminal region-domain-containing protein [Amylostereum chailletii]